MIIKRLSNGIVQVFPFENQEDPFVQAKYTPGVGVCIYFMAKLNQDPLFSPKQAECIGEAWSIASQEGFKMQKYLNQLGVSII